MAIIVIRCLAALLLLVMTGRAVYAQQPPSSTYVPPTVSPPLTAAGTSQGAATALSKNVNLVTIAAGNCPVGGPYTSCNGVGLSSSWAPGDFMQICARGTANGFLVYPDGTGTIMGGAAGAAVRVEVGSCNTFRRLTSGANGQWAVS